MGCICTAQGFEYDWNGVIFGQDLVWREDRWVARRSEVRGLASRRAKTIPDEEFDQLLRNVYKVLLPRAMIGTVLHSSGAEANRLLSRFIAQARI